MTDTGTIVIDENTRIRVEYDMDTESPLTWGDHITQEDDSYLAWAEGEVYGVIVERRFHTITQQVGNPDTDVEEAFEWRETDAIWGCYLNDVYTAEVCAKEYFEVGA